MKINIKKLIIDLYDMKNKDWFGYVLGDNDIFTYHHIIKRENGGKKTIDNGAILTSVSHPYLHVIEFKDLDMYKFLNRILKDINEQRYYPSEMQLAIIDNVLRQFEREHSGERNRKGKLLIKEEYVNKRKI